MKKHIFYTEVAYIVGLILIAAGVVFANKADFGFSMIVAPAYLLHRWLSPTWSFFTFGMAEYCFQAVLLLLMILIIRRFRISYIFSFFTAVLYGFILDGLMALGAGLPADTIPLRILWYIVGLIITALGVAVIFRTYLSPEAYELFVMEISSRFDLDIHRFKIVYDYSSCLVGILMSFAIFGMWKFVGVSWGTIVCALVNGLLIKRVSAFLDKHFHFRDAFPWRKFFTGRGQAQ